MGEILSGGRTLDCATAPEIAPAHPSTAPDDPREFDYLYKQADRIYYEFARRCGLSSCAYWMMYDIERAGGSLALRALTDSWAYSKQTISSAIKSLEARGLIVLAFAEGSRKNKVAHFTDAGRAFTDCYIRPGQEAERRAFCTLAPNDRATLLNLARAYTDALVAELGNLEGELAQAGRVLVDTEIAENGKGETA